MIDESQARMTAFHLIPPFFAALAGALIGVVLSLFLDVNIYALTVACGYAAVLLLLLAFMCLPPRDWSWKGVWLVGTVYFVLTTCLMPSIAMLVFKLKKFNVI